MENLRIEDLSVGDWVMVYGKQRKISVLAEVWNGSNEVLVGYVVHVSPNGYNVVYYKPIEHIKPIPITAEILETNGLCVVEEDADFSEYELFGSENFSLFHTKGTLRYRLETPQASVVCWFVHQLQHALRLAEVEKEIVV
jgi:hypothetical protein